MYIPEEMKLNRFKLIKIPKGKEIWKRLAGVQLREPNSSAYTGDESIPDENKTEMAEYANHKAEYDAWLAEEETKKKAEEKSKE